MSKAVIDADSMLYILGWDVKELPQTAESYAEVIAKTDNFVHNILQAVSATDYVAFLKGHQPTFRHLANPDYKANRKVGSNPWLSVWGSVILHRLIQHWKFEKVEGMEAEDAVSMMAQAFPVNDLTICHIDKDLNQIPGYHYDYKKKAMYTVSGPDAHRNLWLQVLVGDSTDNLPGLPGIGPAKADKMLDVKLDYSWQVMQAFKEKFGERAGIIKFAESYSMIKLLTEPELGFNPLTTVWNPYTPPAVVAPELGEVPLFNFNPLKQ